MNSQQKSARTAPHEYRTNLLETLYRNALKGEGTDLEVTVPNTENDAEEKSRTFHLHHTIVAVSSKYFATFPTPKSRTIDEFDSESFAICLKFMYLGHCQRHDYAGEMLERDNVASVLHCADVLQVDGLKAECIEFLEDHLDHSNYDQVVELAEKFNSSHLKNCALRFKTENSGRDELFARQKSLMADITTAKQKCESATKHKEVLASKLRETELKLEEWYKQENERILSTKWMKEFANRKGKDHEIQNAMGTFNKSGSVGHIVLTSRMHVYQGSAIYKENEDLDSKDNSDSDDEDTSADGYDCDDDYFETRPTPAPTKDQYEQFGIIHSHGSITDAIKAAKPGDRIYLAPGLHRSCFRGGSELEKLDKIFVEKELEIIGVGAAGDVVFEIKYPSTCFEVASEGSVGLYNIKFQVKIDGGDAINKIMDKRSSDTPHHAHGSMEYAMINFRENTPYNEPLKAKFIVKNCIFDMGIGKDSAFPARVSGIFLVRANSAVIEGCKFIGGSGSAIAVVNDPHLHSPNVEINRNMFQYNGQPGISEKTLKSGEEAIPGPASVELFKFNRKLHKVNCELRRDYRDYETFRETEMRLNVTMMGNNFTSNLRAPLACRIIAPRPKCTYYGFRPSPEESTWEVKFDIVDGSPALIHGFQVTLNNNLMKSNGIAMKSNGLAGLTVRKAKSSSPPQKKKTKTDANKTTDDGVASFPDGNTMLIIHHNLSKLDEHTFPQGWGHGEPWDGFWDEYRVGLSDDDEDSDDSEDYSYSGLRDDSGRRNFYDSEEYSLESDDHSW
eukprot:scaffold50088_cov49-Cyclotella_meneghiniana.AAC.5